MIRTDKVVLILIIKVRSNISCQALTKGGAQLVIKFIIWKVVVQ
jgi:hypothetical protein